MAAKLNGKGGALDCAVMAALLCAAAVCGCASEGDSPNRITDGKEDYLGELGTFEGLSAETELRILRDYYDTYIKGEPGNSSVTMNDVRIINYYGTHNGYVVVRIENGLPGIVLPGILSRLYQIDGIVFPWLYPSYPFPTVWNNGQFYSIRELYDSEMLTRGDLESIAGHGYPKDSD
jgi:hypothetical protein